jgi:hypothetical protein
MVRDEHRALEAELARVAEYDVAGLVHAAAALPPLAACALSTGDAPERTSASFRCVRADDGTADLMMQQCQEYEDRDWYSKQPQQDETHSVPPYLV